MLYIPFERRIYRCKNEIIEIDRKKRKVRIILLKMYCIPNFQFLEGNSPKLKGDQSKQSELSS